MRGKEQLLEDTVKVERKRGRKTLKLRDDVEKGRYRSLKEKA